MAIQEMPGWDSVAPDRLFIDRQKLERFILGIIELVDFPSALLIIPNSLNPDCDLYQVADEKKSLAACFPDS